MYKLPTGLLIDLIKDLKREIEADGLIATPEEMVLRLEVIQESECMCSEDKGTDI